MPNLSPEQQAKVDTLMRKARALYEAILRAKIPTAVGLAIRDGAGFDTLNDEGIAAVAVACVEYEKGLAELLAKLAATPTPAAPAASPSGASTTTVVEKKDVEVLPPGAKGRGKASATT